MSGLSKVGAYLKNAWAKEPVIVVSCALGFVAVILPWISPYTKYSGMANEAVPYAYPVPVRDDGNMPDIPSHPCDKEGPSLDWLKNF
ncbi:NADH dehydrogenase [ubiquinone] 1 alpha subcomplex subunit 3 [Anolis carolinensis]|uniref:NADH dehydrogenase [ubiquinone] 1 alpha subcomplex subunit 3 n=1 Tax=Anolis carolinensis TaxID=28377 RepID=H9GMW1_ANOCA|nr:PREDICTED: NADH dehydrogenase [ubiquinone] 1 alpha subcomplex subunit 3 [Anolis carolinensis]|eukprot:XP_008115436.1 PREDICTED: NADH dehydrogenase [ubiquinone] 1 alpha subcomplex subunit 3 [Anolis carolinensis]